MDKEKEKKELSPAEKKKEVFRAIKFTLCSISAGVIQYGSFTLLTFAFDSWQYWVRYLISLILSVLWNFTLNRKFTFQSANNVPVAMLKVAAFYAVFTPVTTVLGHYLTTTLLWNEFLVELLIMVFNFITEYIYDRFVVFGKSIDTNELAKKKAAEEKE